MRCTFGGLTHCLDDDAALRRSTEQGGRRWRRRYGARNELRRLDHPSGFWGDAPEDGPCRFELLGRSSTQLSLENASAALVLLQCVSWPSQLRQKLHHGDVSGLGQRVDRDASPSESQR